MRSVLAVTVLVGCGGGSAQLPVDGAMNDGRPLDTPTDLHLDPTPGVYRETCDGSGATALDFDHFLDVNDENQGLRIYRRGMSGAPVQTLDIAPLLGLQANDEGDLEDLARIGNRVFVIASHGRNTSGQIRPARYRFAAIDLTTTTLPVAIDQTPRFTTTLLADLLVAANWEAPNAAIIQALDTASKLDDNTEASLAPELAGTNIEALAATSTGQLVIGFRNPRPNAKSIVVTLTNPDATVTGTKPRFGGAAELELGGLGIRGMTYSAALGAIVVIAGPHDAAAGPYKLFRWSGVLGEGATLIRDLAGVPAASAPESVVAYPGTADVQVIYDQGDFLVNGTICKDVAVGDRSFGDVIVVP